MCTTESITGTSISTPTTVASAAPDWSPNRLIEGLHTPIDEERDGDRHENGCLPSGEGTSRP
jgi:hypothetical protein